MSEQENPYRDLPPDQLRSESAYLWEQLPFSILTSEVDDQEFDMILTHRMRSQHGRLLMRKLGLLLETSRDYTTRGLRTEIAEIFGFELELGINKTEPQERSFYYLMGLDILERNSIFDPQVVPILERRGYRRALQRHFSEISTLDPDRIKKRYGVWVDQSFLEFAENRALWKSLGLAKEDPHERRLKRWRLDFFNRWGDEL